MDNVRYDSHSHCCATIAIQLSLFIETLNKYVSNSDYEEIPTLSDTALVSLHHDAIH